MGRVYQIKQLALSRLPQAFPLIQASMPEIALEDWLAYGRVLIAAATQGGIMTAEGADRYIYGLFCYRIDASPRYESILTVEHFVVLDMVGQNDTTLQLLGAIEGLAERLRCVHLQIVLPQHSVAPDDGGLRAVLQANGLRIEGVKFGKNAGMPPARTDGLPALSRPD